MSTAGLGAPSRPRGKPFVAAVLRRLALRWRAPALALLLALAGSWLHAQDVLPVPALSARVIDQTGTLGAEQRTALEAKLAAFEAQAGPQIVVLLVATTQPEDIAAYAQRVADTWKIGRRDVGDGLLVVVAKNDRRVRIEVAKALEGAVPDLAARQIIDRQVRPAFRADDYAGGLDAAVDALIARIRGEGLPAPAEGAKPGDGWSIEDLGLFFFVAVPIVGAVLTGLFGRRFGSLLTAAGAGGVTWVLTTSVLLAVAAGIGALLVVGMLGIGAAVRRAGRGTWTRGGWTGGGGLGGGWSGGGGFGGGGGGFSSGGGGDFGGGGASGSW